jgi:hypothetical protein
MNSVVNENECSGQKVPFGAVIGTLPGAKPAAQNGQEPVRLEISWHVAPAQNVAILDLSAQAGGHDLLPADLHQACFEHRPAQVAKI